VVGLVIWKNLPVVTQTSRSTTATQGFAPDASVVGGTTAEMGRLSRSIGTVTTILVGTLGGLLGNTGIEPSTASKDGVASHDTEIRPADSDPESAPKKVKKSTKPEE
jgi:hypothetical protein